MALEDALKKFTCIEYVNFRIQYAELKVSQIAEANEPCIRMLGDVTNVTQE